MTISRRQALLLSLAPRILLAQKQPGWPGFTGLRDRQVIQRDGDRGATLRLGGAAPPEWQGSIELSISGFDARRTVGEVSHGSWHAEAALQTGGPYSLRFDARTGSGMLLASHTVNDVLVGDLWVLAGQSNMQGRGDLVDVEAPSPLVHSFDMAENWVVAEEPLHRLSTARDPVYARPGTDQPGVGAGLGLPFAKRILATTHVPIGLVPCALGGSSIVQWDRSLYGAMLRRIGKTGGAVRGALWYQGETDSRDAKVAWEYGRRLRDLIAALRADTHQPHLAFYLVQVGRMLGWPYYGVSEKNPPPTLDAQFSAVREAQRLVGEQIDHSGAVASIDLELRDGIHIGTPGLKRLGARLANIVLRHEYRQDGFPAGPRLDSVIGDERVESIRVRFSGVERGFSVQGALQGFMLRTPEGAEVPAIFRQSVDPSSRDTVLLQYQGKLPTRVNLFYGWGANPYCNLVDGADMAAPCFGPVVVERR